jgi:penicillin G amidase
MRIVKHAAAAICIVLVLVILSAVVYLKTRIPDFSCTVKIPEIKQVVTIVRDEFGVPHIRAARHGDLYFALGYAQAQDRLFQMDFCRCAARGARMCSSRGGIRG